MIGHEIFANFESELSQMAASIALTDALLQHVDEALYLRIHGDTK